MKGTTAQRGYGGRWQRERLLFLAQHPLCRMCAQQGRAEPATVVDHIIPHRGNYRLMWSRSNWQPLCKRHHDSDKQAIDRGARIIGVDGWPVS